MSNYLPPVTGDFICHLAEGRGTRTPWGKPGFAYFLHLVLCEMTWINLGAEQGPGGSAGAAPPITRPGRCPNPSPPWAIIAAQCVLHRKAFITSF